MISAKQNQRLLTQTDLRWSVIQDQDSASRTNKSFQLPDTCTIFQATKKAAEVLNVKDMNSLSFYMDSQAALKALIKFESSPGGRNQNRTKETKKLQQYQTMVDAGF